MAGFTLEETVQGDDTMTVEELIAEVEGEGDMPYETVGAEGPQEGLRRPARIARKSGYLGFGAAASVLTLAQTTLSDIVQRAFEPRKLLLIPSAVGFVVDSIKIGDEEYIVGAKSVAAEFFGSNALLRPDDKFNPAATGATISVKTTNTTAGTLTIAGAFHGEVMR